VIDTNSIGLNGNLQFQFEADFNLGGISLTKMQNFTLLRTNNERAYLQIIQSIQSNTNAALTSG
jgi:hypothetical protein